MPIPVKAWRTVDAGPAQSLHQMVQPSLVLPLAHAAAHRDEALLLSRRMRLYGAPVTVQTVSGKV